MSTVRTLILVVVLTIIGGVAFIAWVVLSEPSPAEVARIRAVLESTAPGDAPPSYAHCASCHLHDGSGRPDGSIPRLSGQRRTVLEHKLHRMRAGVVHLPVMAAYARTLAPTEITEIAEFLSRQAQPDVIPGRASNEEEARGAALYAQHCASCHGKHGEGHDGLFASRLCGQYEGYLDRRLDEAASKKRGDSDAIMQDVIDDIPTDDLHAIAGWLAAGNGCPTP